MARVNFTLKRSDNDRLQPRTNTGVSIKLHVRMLSQTLLLLLMQIALTADTITKQWRAEAHGRLRTLLWLELKKVSFIKLFN